MTNKFTVTPIQNGRHLHVTGPNLDVTLTRSEAIQLRHFLARVLDGFVGDEEAGMPETPKGQQLIAVDVQHGAVVVSGRQQHAYKVTDARSSDDGCVYRINPRDGAEMLCGPKVAATFEADR